MPCQPYGPGNPHPFPSIRLELLRESLEDYAYLWLLNGGPPEINQSNAGDAVAEDFIFSHTAYDRNPLAIHQARLALAGLVPPTGMPRYYLPLILR